MASNKRKKLDDIYDVFDKHGVALDRDSIWEVQGTPVVYHKDVERLGAALKIKWDIPTIIRNEKDEAVIMVVGRISDVMEWSIGEAAINQNYRVSGKQAAYPYAMAEKRAKDRVILKLAGLHGEVYSEEEADEFKDRDNKDRETPPRREPSRNEKANTEVEVDRSEDKAEAEKKPATDEEIEKRIRDAIAKCETVNAVTDLMLHEATQKAFKRLGKEKEAELREVGVKRLEALGFPIKRKQKEAA